MSSPNATTAIPSAAPRFAHLHLHSEYSLLDGGNTLKRLVKRVKELGMDAVAVTDHGNLHGAVEFYNIARDAGIKPILGIEAYVAQGDRTEKVQTGVKDGGFHLVLLAENNAGWANLMRLSSDSFINGFYYKPRMDKSTLTQWSDGLIAINGHLGSSIAWHLVNYVQNGGEEHWNLAVEEARWHAETFSPNENGEPRFFIELQKHDTPLQMRINPHLIRLAKELNLPLVCDNDAHFLTASDWDTHDTLCCISMQKIKAETDRIHYPRDLYVKSPEQMADTFSDVPEAVENAGRIAARCNVELDFSASHAPVVRVQQDPIERGSVPAFPNASMHPDNAGSTEWYVAFCNQFTVLPYDETEDHDVTRDEIKKECDDVLRQLCEAGLYWRYWPDGLTDEIRARLDYELQVLADKEISAYFLICWDFVNYARSNGIPANARGSGVGTMVGYVLGLSNACPVTYGLLFERFTDPDRSEYPDIDIDICQDGRADVINYVRQKYGHVAQIITFGRLKAKAAFKDVARVMGFAPTEAQKLSNMVPAELNITIDEALKKEPDLKKLYDTDERTRTVIDHARALENHARHAGIHAAGVVVATQPLENIVPLCKASGSDDVVTQWDGPTCEMVGLLKMDFLGLRTLSIMERAKQIVRETLPAETIAAIVQKRAVEPTPSGRGQGGGEPAVGDPLDLDRIPFDDQTVLDVFRRGDTTGLFQFSSGGMRQLLIEMQPDRLEDLIAANALYRPGPMELIGEYNQRKHGKTRVPEVHPIVDDFTRETYGIMVYQEQVMQIVHGLGGIPLRAAYTLIKAISKKKESVINAVRPKFVEGAQEQGLTRKQADDLFDLILKFAGYGFNKSHSTGYAIIAYQTAFLKSYFPAQYMAAVLTYESQAKKVDDWITYLDDCRRAIWPDHAKEKPHVGIEVGRPDINLSDAAFTVVFEDDEPRDNLHGHIRFGLSAIKGAGNAAIRSIIQERNDNGPYESIFDFCERIDLRNVNKATIEALIKCGAFDSVHSKEDRAALVEAIDDAVKAGQTAAADRAAGQSTFFDSFASAEPEQTSRETTLPAVTPWTELEALQFEKDVLGFYTSGHPLDRHAKLIDSFCTHSVRDLREMEGEVPVILAAVLSGVRSRISNNGRNAGRKWASFNIQDRTGSMEGIAFAEAFEKYAHLIHNDSIVFLIGRVDRRRAEPSVVVERVLDLAGATVALTTCVEIEYKPNGDSSDAIDAYLNRLHDLLQEAGHGVEPGSGAADVLLHLHIARKRVTIRPSMLRVTPDPPLLARLETLVGDANIRLRGAAPGKFMRNGGQNNGNGYRKTFSGRNNNNDGESCASIDRY